MALYEALYGERPFAGETVAELARNLARGEIAEPSSRARSELDFASAIKSAFEPLPAPPRVRRALLRGLAIDPDDRYPSMAELLADLRGRKRTRRWPLALALAAIAAVVVGLVALRGGGEPSGLCPRAEGKLADVWDDARRRAVRAALLATGESHAAATHDRARKALDGYARSWLDTHQAVCRATRVTGEQSERLLDVRMACLERRRRALGALTARLAPDAGQSADGLARGVLDKSIEAALALDPIAACTSARAPGAGDGPAVDPAVEPALAEEIAAIRYRLDEARIRESLGQYREGLAIAGDAATRARAAGDPAIVSEAATALALLEEKAGDLAAAAENLQVAARAAAEAADDHLAAVAWTRLSRVVGYRQKRLDQADLLLTAAENAIIRAGDRAGNPDILRGELFTARAAVSLTRGERDEARRNFELALEARQRALPAGHPDIARSLANVGAMSRSLGRLDESIGFYERALALKNETLGPSHPSTATTLFGLGVTYKAQGRYDRAAELLERALAIREKTLGPEHPEVARLLNELGYLARLGGDHDKAIARHRAAIDMATVALRAGHPDIGKYENGLGQALHETGELGEAGAAYQRALDIFLAAHGPDHHEVGVALVNLGRAAQDRERCFDALVHYERALAIFEAREPKIHAAFPLTGIGACRVRMGQPGQAMAMLERALELRVAGNAEPAELADTQLELAKALWDARGDRRRAVGLAQSALEGYLAAGDENRVAIARDWLDERDRRATAPPP